jgi:hypothetical protein
MRSLAAQQSALRAHGWLLAGPFASASASVVPEISRAIAPPPSDRGVMWPSPAPLRALPRWAACLRRRRPPCVKLLHFLIKSFAPWLAAAGCSSVSEFAPARSGCGLVRAGPPPRRVAGIHNFHNPQFDPRPAGLHRSTPCTDTKCSSTATLPALTSALQAMRDRGAHAVCSLRRDPPPMPGRDGFANAPAHLTQLSWRIISGHASDMAARCLVCPYRPNEAPVA